MTMRKPILFDRPGFTFVEVLFAIIILGIGMIMLAAMLPVAISQTASTRDQIAGKSAAEAGYAYMKVVARSGGKNAYGFTGAAINAAGYMQPATAIPPQSPIALPNNPANLANYKSSRIMSSDPSVQWVPFYRRDPGSNVVKAVIVATRITGNEFAPRYDAATLDNETELANAADANPNLRPNGPHLVAVRVVEGHSDPDQLHFLDESSRSAIDPPMAAPGAFVIIREQNSPAVVSADPQATYRNNGRVFRLASKVDGTVGRWNLSPDYDLQPISLGADGVSGTIDDTAGPDKTPGTADDNYDYSLDPGVTIASAPLTWGSTDQNDCATAWLIGKAASDPTDPSSNTYVGVAQDIGVLQFEMTLE